MLTKTRLRATIAGQVADFLASGGEIQAVDHTANHSHKQPLKRKIKDQVAYRKRYNQLRRQT